MINPRWLELSMRRINCLATKVVQAIKVQLYSLERSILTLRAGWVGLKSGLWISNKMKNIRKIPQ